jgi:hypothetical protein
LCCNSTDNQLQKTRRCISTDANQRYNSSIYWTIYLQGVDKYGNKDATPAKFTIIIKDCKKPAPGNGNPETWINWVKDCHGRKIPNGGTTSCHRFTVDFQSTATDTGKGSHVDFKIDNGRYKAVASRLSFTIPGQGYHTIYLRGVDTYGNEDPTPAKFSFTIDNDDIMCPVSADSDEEDPCAAFCGRGACAEIGPENDTDGSPPSPPPPSPPPKNDTGGPIPPPGEEVPIECANKSTTEFGIHDLRGVYHPGETLNVYASFSKFPVTPDEDGMIYVWRNSSAGHWVATWIPAEESAHDPPCR